MDLGIGLSESIISPSQGLKIWLMVTGQTAQALWNQIPARHIDNEHCWTKIKFPTATLFQLFLTLKIDTMIHDTYDITCSNFSCTNYSTGKEDTMRGSGTLLTETSMEPCLTPVPRNGRCAMQHAAVCLGNHALVHSHTLPDCCMTGNCPTHADYEAYCRL